MQDSGIGNKEFFQYIVGTTPIKFAGSSRDAVYIFNEGGPDIRLGNTPAIASSYGTPLPSGMGLLDSYSDDDWYAATAASSGTLSGFIVRS